MTRMQAQADAERAAGTLRDKPRAAGLYPNSSHLYRTSTAQLTRKLVHCKHTAWSQGLGSSTSW